MSSEDETNASRSRLNLFRQPSNELVDQLKVYGGDPFSFSKHRNEILSICGSYVCIIFPRVALSAVQSNIKDDLGLGNSEVGDLLLVSALAYMAGKAFNGMIVDCMDARYVLFIFMTMSALACFGWSFMNTLESMYPWVIVNMYCQAGTWPSMAKLIYNWFDPNAYSETFIYLSISSKLGSVFTLLLLGAFVSATDWRWTLRVASLVQGLGLVYGVLMMKIPAPPERNDHRPYTEKQEGKGVIPLCKVIHNSSTFWLALAAICMMTAMSTMENYMTLWLTDVFRPCLDTEGDACSSLFDSGHASIVLSLMPLGLIFSLIYGLYLEKSNDPYEEAKISVLFLTAATFILVIFSIWTTMVESGTRPKENPWNWVGGISVFILLYGFLIGYPYYIPIAVYSVKIGGMNSATLSAFLDLGGFLMVTIVITFGLTLSESDGVSEEAKSTWRNNMYLNVFIGLFATLAMFGFQRNKMNDIQNPNFVKSVRLSVLKIDSSTTQIQELTTVRDELKKTESSV